MRLSCLEYFHPHHPYPTACVQEKKPRFTICAGSVWLHHVFHVHAEASLGKGTSFAPAYGNHRRCLLIPRNLSTSHPDQHLQAAVPANQGRRVADVACHTVHNSMLRDLQRNPIRVYLEVSLAVQPGKQAPNYSPACKVVG